MFILDNVFTNEHGEAITILQLITKIKTSIYQVDNILNDYLIRLDTIDSVNNTQNTDILVLKGNVDLLKSQVAKIFKTIGDYLLQLQQLDILTQTHSSQITDIQNVNQSQGTKLINLNSKSLEHDLKITGLETNVTNINNSLNNIDNSIGDMLLQLLQLDVLTQTHTSQISDLQNVNTTHTASIATITSSVNDLTTLVNNLQNTCTTLTTDLNSLTSRVTPLETNDKWQNDQISSLTTFTQLNTNNISTLNTLVGNLDDRIDVLENISNTIDGCLELDATNLFETGTSATQLDATTLYKLWEYPSNVDTNKTLVNIQSSFAMGGDSTQFAITTPNGTFNILPISAGVVSPVNLNIDFIYKITSGVMFWYGVYTLLINGKYPVVRFFSSSTNYPHANEKTFPLENTHLGVSFSAATIWLQPYVKITEFKLGG